MNIYTRKGDRGVTRLAGGERVSKNHPLVRVGGDLDELNSMIGVVRAFLPDTVVDAAADLKRVQSELLTMHARLPLLTSSPDVQRPVPVAAQPCEWIEKRIDDMSAALPVLKTFILPGGHPSAAWAHVARCVCRRVESDVVALADAGADFERLGPMIAYLNRLSDFLFVLARYLNQAGGVTESLWTE